MNLQSLIPKQFRSTLKPAKQKILGHLFGYDYQADGIATTGHNTEFMTDSTFSAAWDFAAQKNERAFPEGVPDIRWRAHVACWAAENARSVDGDFVECGVHMGLLSHVICQYLDFATLDKSFWLFDTYEGIPEAQLLDSEIEHGSAFNDDVYFDCYALVKESFNYAKNVNLVKGLVPDSLKKADISKVAYLSIDMNNAYAEVAALEYFWPLLSPGAFVVLDDYGFSAHHTQKTAIDSFLRTKNKSAVTLPTGQGLIVI